MTRESLQTLAIPATASYAEIVAALSRSHARQVAMLFPLRVPSPLAQPALLDALRIRSQEMGKTILVIGGDDRLRACAVSVGLTAATTLEDWRAAQSSIWTWDAGWNTTITNPIGQTGPQRATTASGVQHRAPLRLVEQDTERDLGTAGEYDPWNVEPPAFVSELVEEMAELRRRQQAAEAQANDQAYNQRNRAAPSAYYSTPSTDPFTDSTEREALTREIEQYEAAITNKIRVTSAPVIAASSHPSHPSQPGSSI